MCLSVLCALLLFHTSQGQTASNFIQTFAIENLQLQDITFTSKMLFKTETESVLSCAMKCRLAHCASFTFTLSSPPSSESSSSSNSSCQGHSTVMTADDASVAAPASALFVFDWLEMACTNNSQCLARNSECFAGTCLCTPGYYYSNTSLSCLDNCPSEDLQSTFVAYPGLALLGYNQQVVLEIGLSECQKLCSASPLIRTFDLVSNIDCYMQHVDMKVIPSSSWHSRPNIVHYQKTCL